MGTTSTRKCRECGKDVRGSSYLGLARVRPSTICLVCVDKMTAQTGVPSRMGAFAEWYRQHQAPQTATQKMAALQEEINELRALLEKRTDG